MYSQDLGRRVEASFCAAIAKPGYWTAKNRLAGQGSEVIKTGIAGCSSFVTGLFGCSSSTITPMKTSLDGDPK
ncbi:hypothetical protein SORBI_3007G052500 [Sorghum bicolor]|uniref:Uncharacterized protein n=1 Tax=Sorghum bicolor TaxID=4558 RepID=A0A1B6PFQ1_SORBI|nr:hypothetical protein SORBI_3007G052500 [Sorghum bicolor]